MKDALYFLALALLSAGGLACLRANKPQGPLETVNTDGLEVGASSRAPTAKPNEDNPTQGIRVTRVLFTESTNGTGPGYPSTGSTTWELSANSHPGGKEGFDALMNGVLDRTTYAGQVPLRRYIELRLHADAAEWQGIDKKVTSDAAPKGSSSSNSLTLYEGKRELYRFRYDRSDPSIYSGDFVQKLQSAVTSGTVIHEDAGDLPVRAP